MKSKKAPEGAKETKIQTGFRVSEPLNNEIEQAAEEYCISKNALMTIDTIISGINLLY